MFKATVYVCKLVLRSVFILYPLLNSLYLVDQHPLGYLLYDMGSAESLVKDTMIGILLSEIAVLLFNCFIKAIEAFRKRGVDYVSNLIKEES